MSTKITTLYNNMVTRIEALFPNKHRLTNPYAVELNGHIFLKDGWGLAVSSGENTNRQLSCTMSINRTMIVTLTNELLATELDPVTKAVMEKTLLEDHFTLIKDFEKDTTINSSSFRTSFLSDSGIQFVVSEDKPFIYIQAIFETEYMEDLNT